MASFAIYFADFRDTGVTVYVSLNLVIKLPTFKFPNEETYTYTHTHTHVCGCNLYTTL